MIDMMVLVSVVLLWGLVHSLLASLAAKGFFARALGPTFMRFYRLGYNLFSAVSFLPVLWLVVILPDRRIYTIPSPWMYLMIAGQGGAAFLLLLGLLQTDALSFIGLRQLLEAASKPPTLVVSGLYRFVRHPLYTAGLLFIWLTPSMTANMLALYLSLTLYIVIGAHFEEQKLLREYGQAYESYKTSSPMFVPGLIFKRNK